MWTWQVTERLAGPQQCHTLSTFSMVPLRWQLKSKWTDTDLKCGPHLQFVRRTGLDWSVMANFCKTGQNLLVDCLAQDETDILFSFVIIFLIQKAHYRSFSSFLIPLISWVLDFFFKENILLNNQEARGLDHLHLFFAPLMLLKTCSVFYVFVI